MVFMALIALILGVLYGLSGLTFIDFIVENKEYVLYFLMFLVGISIGLNKGILKKLKEYHFKVFIIPFGIITGSILGGVVCSYLLNIDMNITTAISSGLGWYSLSGIMITNLTNATYGSITFLSNLMREIFSFFCIPLVAKYLNYLTCIAPAGATSEDTTLSMMIKYTNEETVVLSVLNGMICSTLVPILINLCFKIF